MALPERFGEFWPDGDFEYDSTRKESGWSNRLRRHYLAQSPEEQIRLYDYHAHGSDEALHGAAEYPAYVAAKFISEMGTKDRPDGLRLTSVNPHEAPLTFDTEKTYAKLGSLIKLNDRILAVNEDLKAVIERFEPEVHQFFPIQIIMPNRSTFPEAYYTIVIGRYCDSFSPEKSSPNSYRTYPAFPGFYNCETSKKGITGLSLRKAGLDGAHLWRERAFRQNLTCFSDELISEIEKVGLSLPPCYRMRIV